MAAMNRSIGPLLKTFVFTVFVPGTVAGYVPLRLRRGAAPVAGVEAWAAISVIGIGSAIYLYPAFWGFALIGGGTPAPIAPTKILVVKGLHHYLRNPMYIGVAFVIGGQAWLFHSLPTAIYMVCMLLTATCSSSFMKSQRCGNNSGRNTIVTAKQYRAGYQS